MSYGEAAPYSPRQSSPVYGVPPSYTGGAGRVDPFNIPAPTSAYAPDRVGGGVSDAGDAAVVAANGNGDAFVDEQLGFIPSDGSVFRDGVTSYGEQFPDSFPGDVSGQGASPRPVLQTMPTIAERPDIVITQGLPIPEHKIGWIIGKRGSYVKQLEEKSGCSLRISDDTSTEYGIIWRYVMMRGTGLALMKCKQLIQLRLEKLPAGIEELNPRAGRIDDGTDDPYGDYASSSDPYMVETPYFSNGGGAQTYGTNATASGEGGNGSSASNGSVNGSGGNGGGTVDSYSRETHATDAAYSTAEDPYTTAGDPYVPGLSSNDRYL